MQNVIMLTLLVIVIASSCGILFMFKRKLHSIEEELWGEKRLEAERTAMLSSGKGDVESDEDDETES